MSTATSRKTQPDLFDCVIDNRAMRRREIYRGGRLVATAPATLDAPTLRVFSASGPFGTYPDHPSHTVRTS